MKYFASFLGAILFLFVVQFCVAQSPSGEGVSYNTPGTGNPLLPGYFADPTVKKFGGRYFIYATTDGTGWGTGPSQVWYSDDFVNWTLTEMNWPTTEVYWAPDAWQGPDEKYYLYYSQPVQLHGGVADTPYGPWKELTPDGSPIVPNRYVPMSITLDGQTFLDDDGSRYMYWGTWGIYKGHGVGWGKLNRDMKSFSDTSLIPNTEATDFFEAPFMMKRNGIYYFMYSSGSCHDHTYRIQYAVSQQGPTEGFAFAENNPVLETNEDGSVHGPGHHSILQEDDQYYIVYHRHDNPHSSNGFHRQVAADVLEFEEDGRIQKVIPTHRGVGYLADNTNPFRNLVAGKTFKASSNYSEDFKGTYAIDENYGTLWMPSPDDERPSITVDLGEKKRVRRTRTSFQYATHYYQYLIEYSLDGRQWETFSDKRNNVLAGSPMVDYNDLMTRYLRLTITGIEKQGFPKAVWEFKAFDGYLKDPEQLLVHLESEDLKPNQKSWTNNRGMYGGVVSIPHFTSTGTGNNQGVVFDGEVRGEVAPVKVNPYMDYTAIVSYLNAKGKLSYASLVWNAKEKRFSGLINPGDEDPDTSLKPQIQKFINEGVMGPGIPITSVKVFNRALHPSEIAYYGLLSYKRAPPVAVPSKGLLVDLSAEDLTMGEEVLSLSNKGTAGGTFRSKGRGPLVDFVAGKTALVFDNSQSLQSTIPTPASLGGNNPYTIMAWAFNPEIAPDECVFEWAPGGKQILTSGSLQYGTLENQGAVIHRDWADMGYNNLPAAGSWHHLAVSFDGYMEKVYVDGKPDGQEQKWLFVEPGEKMTLGNSLDRQSSFSGAIASIRMYDRALDEAAITEAFESEATGGEVLVYLSPNDLGYGDFSKWNNQAEIAGSFVTHSGDAVVEVRDGRLALTTENTEVRWESITRQKLPATFHIKMVIFSDGKWHHYVYTRTGSGVKTYVDGVPGFDEKVLGPFGFEKAVLIEDLVLPTGISIASYEVKRGAISDEGVKRSYRDLDLSGAVEKEKSFRQNPLAMSSVSASMKGKAFDAVPGVRYLFIRNDGEKSSWQQSPDYMDHTLVPGCKYAYRYLVKDFYGRILANSDPVQVVTDGSTYSEQVWSFDEDGDLLNSDDLRGFDGMVKPGLTEGAAITISDGHLKLSSRGSGWDEGMKRGVFVYKEVTGDFIAEVELIDYSGLIKKERVAYNDPSLMVVLPSSVKNDNWEYAGLSYFPLYRQGNMITNQRNGRKSQHGNLMGWQAHKFLQVERRGPDVYFRTSADGIHWVNMDRSPMTREDFDGESLYVGLGHVTHSDNHGYVIFDNFRVSSFNWSLPAK